MPPSFPNGKSTTIWIYIKKWSGGPFFHELENQRASYGPGDHFFTSQKIKGRVMVRGYKQFGELFVPEP